MNTEQPNNSAEALNQLRLIGAEVRRATDLEHLRPLFYRQDALARLYPHDASVQFLASEIKQQISERGTLLMQSLARPTPPPQSAMPASSRPPSVFPQPSPIPAMESTLRFPSSPAPDTREPFFAPEPPTETPFAPPPVAAPSPVTPTQPPLQPPPAAAVPPPAPKRKSGMGKMLAAAATTAMATLAVLAFFYSWPRQKPAPPKFIDIEVTTTPPGARIRIDEEDRGTSDLRIALPPGPHRIEATLPGYEPAPMEFPVGEDKPKRISILLQPQVQTVRLLTDMTAGTATVDNGSPQPLQQGQLDLNDLPAGEHAIVVAEGKRRASFRVRVAPGAQPVLIGPVEATDLLAVMVATGPAETSVRASVPTPLAIDGNTMGNMSAEPLVLKDVPAGDHELTFGAGADAKKRQVTLGGAASLFAFLIFESKGGSLLVVAGVDGARVTLNGKPQSRLTARGQVRFAQLEPGDYEVSVSKEGFEPAEARKVTVRKGEDTRVPFTLKAIPQLASLSIAGALPGTSVLIDQQPAGETGADGTLTLTGIAPGPHTVELRRDRHEKKSLQKTFAAGETLEMRGGEVALVRLPAVVRLQVTPADAAVTVKEEKDAAARPVQGPRVTLAEGSYAFTATAPGYTPATSSIRVAGGDTPEVVLTLRRVEVKKEPPPPPPVRVSGMEAFENPGGWTQENGWYVRKGGGFVPLRAPSVKGTIGFTIDVVKGKRAQWALGYGDPKNYVFFQLDKSNLARSQVINGKRRELLKTKHGVRGQDAVTVAIEIDRHKLTHRVLADGVWKTVETWENPDVDFTAGRFAFVIPDGDRWMLSNFSFKP